MQIVELDLSLDIDYDFLLTSSGTGVVALGDDLPDNGDGSFRFSAAQFPSLPVSGSGVLVRFKIEALAAGSSPLSLDTVKLSDGSGAPIEPSDSNNFYTGPLNDAAVIVDSTCDDLDSDGDGAPDVSDNCPAWPNPGQGLPPWTVPPDDPDCDGFPDAVEDFVGTDAEEHCADSATPNNEDPPDVWPVDFNDDQMATGSDILRFGLVFGSSAPGPPYDARYDFSMDGLITGSDILKFGPFYGETCA